MVSIKQIETIRDEAMMVQNADDSTATDHDDPAGDGGVAVRDLAVR